MRDELCRGDRVPQRNKGVAETFLALTLGLAIAVRVSGQNSTRTSVGEELPIAHATRVDHAPAINGTLSDPLWQQAEPITDFRQREPFEGQAATEKTEVRILYSRSEVYFGISCHDYGREGPVASQLRRDASQELDDYFEIIIDSQRDRRNAYVFQVNALGTQRDALITNEQEGDTQDGDPAWDGVWISESRIASDGWTATIAIPFSTLNFMHANDVVWGLNFKRFIRRKNEEDLWAGWRRVFGPAKISQAGELNGISGIGSGRLLIVKPYGLVGFTRLPSNAGTVGLTPGTTALYTGGLDAKIGLRSNVVANLTVNTDFADADVDVQQLSLSPYKLFFPEKRQFFLENAGVFAFPIAFGGTADTTDQLFFSRQIGIDPITGQQVPINAGAKITGSVSPFEFGLMDVDTRSSGPNPGANFAVGRIKGALDQRGSYLGGMLVDKRSASGIPGFNQSAGIDGRVALLDNLIVNGYAAQTRTPGYSSGQSDVGLGLTYRSNWLDFLAGRQKIGPNFNPQVGFLERADCICDTLDANFKIRPNFANTRELQFESFIFHEPSTTHVVQTQEWATSFRAKFNNSAYTDDDIVDVFTQLLTTPFNLYRNTYIPAGIYHWTRHAITAGSPEDRRLNVRLYERFGSYYDGTLNELRLNAAYRVNKRLFVAARPEWDRFRLPVPGGNFSVALGALETDYAFTRMLSLSSVLQIDTTNNQAVSANLRLRWNYRPDSDLFVIYTSGQQFASLAATNPSQFHEDRFAIKLTYSWSPKN